MPSFESSDAVTAERPIATQGALGAHAEIEERVTFWNTLVPIPLERSRDVAAGLEQRVSKKGSVLQRAVAALARRAAGRVSRVSQ